MRMSKESGRPGESTPLPAGRGRRGQPRAAGPALEAGPVRRALCTQRPPPPSSSDVSDLALIVLQCCGKMELREGR